MEKGTGKKVDEDTMQAGSLDEAAAAADAELRGGDAAAAEAKGEAKEWNKNQTLLRKNMMKCKSTSFLSSYFALTRSLHLGLGKRNIPIHIPPHHGPVRTHVCRPILSPPVRRPIGRGRA